MNDFTQEQCETVFRITQRLTFRLSAALDIEIEQAALFSDWLKELVIEGVRLQVLRETFLVVLDHSASTETRLTADYVGRTLARGPQIFIVGIDGSLLMEPEPFDATITTAISQSKDDEPRFVFLVTAPQIIGFCTGLVEYDLNVQEPGRGLQPGIQRYHVSEFPRIVRNHYERCVHREQGVVYWSDRAKRILDSGKYGTEYIFHFSLLCWLKAYATGFVDVVAEPSGLGQDKHDIRVITPTGKIVIEIKWLGKSVSQTFDQTAIDGGLVQVRMYLENDTSIETGYLVAYDARSEEEHKSNSTWNPDSVHERCCTPIIQFLQSETPSEAGKAAMRQAKGKRKDKKL